jgi:hypothetical protein
VRHYLLGLACTLVIGVGPFLIVMLAMLIAGCSAPTTGRCVECMRQYEPGTFPYGQPDDCPKCGGYVAWEEK